MPASSPLRSLLPTAWLIVVLLWPVALLNYLDRQMLASMKFSVMADITSIANDENWGWMLGQFKWVYAFLSPIGGYVADRFSRRFTICASLFVWSAVTYWTGQVSTFNELLLARSLMGISEAFYIPAALALISDHHLGRTRSRAVALHQMAIYCGVILGGFGGYVADAPDLGWRFAFTAAGVFGMLYAVPLVFLLRDPPMLEAGEEAPTISPITAARELFTNTSFILLVLYFTLPALAGWIIRDWMPAILKVRFQIGQGEAGVSATLFWQSAAIVGAMVGGWLADRWMQRTQRGRIHVSAIGMVLLVPALLGVGIADTLGLAIAFLILFGIGWGFFDCNNMPILCQIVRPELRATGYGIMNLVSISCGGGADWAFGAMRVRGISDAVIFTILGSASVVSIALVMLVRPKRKIEAT
jgi:MFS family permease